LNTNLFIAKTLWSGGAKKHPGGRNSFIAGISVAVSMIVMIVAIAVSDGFKTEIREKAAGFSGTIILSAPGIEVVNSKYPVDGNLSYRDKISSLEGVTGVQNYAYSSGIMKFGDEIQGIVLKGVDETYNWDFFKKSLREGRIPDYADSLSGKSILISSRLSSMLGIECGEKVQVYFVGESVKARAYMVAGIYDAQLEEIDKALVVANIDEVTRLNGWMPGEVSGIEIMTEDFGNTRELAAQIETIIEENQNDEESDVSVTTVEELYPHLFDWLTLLDFNVLIVLILMVIVAGFNMISGLLIILFEKISMIGLLKSLGMRDASIHRIFLYRAMMIVLRGIAAGNIIALVLLTMQHQYGFITLDPANYFVTQVPVHIDWLKLTILNIASAVMITLILYIPSVFIAGVEPDKSLRVQ